MEFRLTEEQQMLQDSARRFLEEECAFQARQPFVARGAYDEHLWQQFAELGWLGMALPEAFEGLGGGAVETAILMEEIGRSLCVMPYWAVAVLSAQTIAASDRERAGSVLPALISGQSKPVLAHGEPCARGAISHVTTSAVRVGSSGWRLNGNKSLVIGGNVADRFVVSARTSGAADDEDGITLFLVDRAAYGVTVRDVRLIDNRWCADLTLADVDVFDADVLGQVGAAYPAIDEGHAHAMIALCAEAIGVMEKSLWITRDYLKTRKQFGAALSSFQALQHRMSEMLIELELSRSMVHKALASMSAEPRARQRALSAAKVHIGKSGKFVCGQAIQLHGGIGVTEEYIIGHYFKRITAIENALGTSHFHVECLAQAERERVA